MRDAHQLALLTAAKRLGIDVEDRLDDWGIDAVQYRFADRAVVIIDGRINHGLSFTAAQLCLSKPATRSILAELGLPVPVAVLLPDDSHDALASLIDSGPVVCKPPQGEWGTGVAMDLSSVDAVLEQLAHLGGVALVEEQVEGKDLRIQALGGRFQVACIREPASVIGDGNSRVSALIQARAQEVARLNPDNRLVVDVVTERLLTQQGLTLDDIPSPGRQVMLKRISNLSQGGRAIDVTEEVHPVYREWTAAIGDRLGLDFFAIDVVTPDPTLSPAESPAWILEVNAPCQWLAHTFSERRSHDLPTKILCHILQLPQNLDDIDYASCSSTT